MLWGPKSGVKKGTKNGDKNDIFSHSSALTGGKILSLRCETFHRRRHLCAHLRLKDACGEKTRRAVFRIPGTPECGQRRPRGSKSTSGERGFLMGFLITTCTKEIDFPVPGTGGGSPGARPPAGVDPCRGRPLQGVDPCKGRRNAVRNARTPDTRQIASSVYVAVCQTRRGKRVTPKPPRQTLVIQGPGTALNSVPDAPEGAVLHNLSC